VSKNGRCISKPRLLDKSRALYGRIRERDPFLPPLLSTAGTVEVKDAVRVILPTTAGIATVIAVPVGGWRFELSTYDEFAVAQPAAAVDQAKSDADALRDDLKALRDLTVDFERRVDAFAAKHHPHNNNVITIRDVAAE
jgi:hypothetical protein